MVINFDARCLQDPGYRSSGIGRYAEWLLLKLSGSAAFTVKLAIDPEGPYRDRLPDREGLETISFSNMRSGIYLNPSLMTHNSEPLELAAAKALKRVGVMHDLIPLRRPSESSEYDLTLFEAMLRKSSELDLIVTNSVCTMEDYRALYSAVPISVLHPESRFATDRYDVVDAEETAQAILEIARPYVFFAVADHPRKNIELAARAAPALRNLGFTTVIGGGISAATIERLRQSHDLSMVLFTPRLTDQDLATVYAGAESVVIPSYDEGFSLPVLEAVNLGCKVLVSDIAAHREQVLDSRHLFRPDDLDGFIDSFHATSSLVRTNHATFDHQTELTQLLNRLQ